MKVVKPLLRSSKACVICGILGVVSISPSVHSEDSKKGPAEPAIVRPTQSVFVIPHTEQEGMRDPFFPKSHRPFDHAPAQIANVKAVVRRAELKLQGMSGPPNHRLPIINGRTLELNEEAEVSTPDGKVTVRLLEIKGDTVVVASAGEHQTLKLRGGL
jgi:hypothetical protein